MELNNNNSLNENIDEVEFKDELLEDIARYMIFNNETSTNKVQVFFKIGFVRATKIIDKLIELGVISESNNIRTINTSLDQLTDILKNK